MLFFGRDSYERKLSNHHDQGRRQGATAIIEFFSVTHTSKNFEGARGRLCSSKGGACGTAQWHYGQSKPGCPGRVGGYGARSTRSHYDRNAAAIVGTHLHIVLCIVCQVLASDICMYS